MSWSLHQTTSTTNRIYERPLGGNEQGFYWDAEFSGTADTLQQATISARGRNRSLFDKSNVSKAWEKLRYRFPLLGARIVEEGSQLKFIVEERNLKLLNGDSDSSDVEVLVLPCAKEVQEFASGLLTGDRQLNASKLARIYLVKAMDTPYSFDIIILAAHIITDGIANTTIMRTFLEFLASPEKPEIAELDLPDKLALARASESLVPLRGTPARRNWHKAIGVVLYNIRSAKLSGGHTLPRTFTSASMQTPAASNWVATAFDPNESAMIFQKCRKLGLTFGNAYPILGQVAMTRVLCRRFLCGEISPAEWEFRRSQPMLTAGPINLRPHLDKTWYRNGGSENVSLSISFFLYTLPYMPLGSAAGLKPGDNAPDFHELLSPDRFRYRSLLVRKQAENYLRHPLFLDISAARLPSRVERTRGIVQEWQRNRRAGIQPNLQAEVIPVMKQSAFGPVIAHGGSSFGNVDPLLPRQYPLTASKPKIRLISSGTRLHCRPGELYLGAATSGGQLKLTVFWDQNMFDEATVREWLQEVEAATKYYLGHDSDSHSKL